MTGAPPLQAVLDFFFALVANAGDLCDSAVLLVRHDRFGLARTHAIAAEEELGKADDVAKWYLATSRGEEPDYKKMTDSWKRHELKLLVAQMADDRREFRESAPPSKLPSTLDGYVQMAVSYYEHVSKSVSEKHAARMAGLYVDLVGGQLRKPSNVSRDDAMHAIERAQRYLTEIRLLPIPALVPVRLTDIDMTA